MGMFDSVIIICPNCGAEVEFQSKAGVCLLNRYSIAEVPSDIAGSLNGKSESCEKCSKLIYLRAHVLLQVV